VVRVPDAQVGDGFLESLGEFGEERGEMGVGDRRGFAVVRGISRRAWGRGVCIAQRRCLSLGPGRHLSKDTGAAESGLRIEVRV